MVLLTKLNTDISLAYIQKDWLDYFEDSFCWVVLPIRILIKVGSNQEYFKMSQLFIKLCFSFYQNEAHDRVLMFPLQILDQWKDPEIVHAFRRYHTSVQREMEGDTNIRDLVIAQCLFSKENTTCPEFMK